jgi:hypothetical protein
VNGQSRRGSAFLRLLAAHGVAYPVAIAWAFGSIPLMVVRVATAVGLTLDDEEIAHRVFVLVHAAGAVWAFAKDAARARRLFIATTAVLLGVPIVGGGASWIWLVTRP